MTGSLKLASLMSVTALAVTHLASGGFHHLLGARSADPVLASRIEQRVNRDVVVLDSSVPVEFVQFLRRDNPEKRFIVFPNAGLAEHFLRRSEQIERRMNQVREVIGQQEIKYVVVSDLRDKSQPGNSLLAVVRRDPRFELLGTFPLAAGADGQTRNLYLYENTGLPEASDGSYLIGLR